MPNDYVPWMIGGGVQHPVEIARLLAHVATTGRDNILGAKSLEVRAQETPNASVRVFPGAAAIRSRAAGTTYDSYIAKYPDIVNVPIAPQGASGTRYDMILARVEDPFQAGEPWDSPSEEDMADGTAEYSKIRAVTIVDLDVLSHIEDYHLGYTAIPLALIAMPANATVVIQDYITDFRSISMHRSQREQKISNEPDGSLGDVSAEVDGDWDEFPGPASYLSTIIPEWATHALIKVIVSGVSVNDSVEGALRVSLGDGGVDTVYGPETYLKLTPHATFDAHTFIAAADLAIPEEIRNTQAYVRMQGRREIGNDGSLNAGDSAVSIVEVDFIERPESNV